MIDVEKVVVIVRWYEDGENYESSSPYAAVATIHLLNKNTAFITGMHGSINRTRLRELAKWFKDNNYTKIYSFRNGELTEYSPDVYLKGAAPYDGL